MDYVTLFATCVKSKTYFASIEFENILNSPWPFLLFKTVLRDYLKCFLSSVATDGKDGHGLKLEKVGPCKNHQKQFLVNAP